MNQLTTQWTYSTTATSEDKSRPRTATRHDRAFELVGVDGSVEGGLRPLAGFRKVRDFDFYLTSGVSSNYLYDASAEVVDFFPVTFRINDHLGAEGYGYGYVYRIVQSGKTTVVAIEYFNSLKGTKGSWYTPAGTSQSTPPSVGTGGVDDTGDVLPALSTHGDPADANTTCFLTNRFTDTDKQMSVSVWGKFVYIFCEGQDPVLFYVDDSTSAMNPITIGALTGDPKPGPGKQPKLMDTIQVAGRTDEIDAAGIYIGEQVVDEDGALTLNVSPEAGYPASGRIVAIIHSTNLENLNYGNETTDPCYHNSATGEPADTVNDDAHVFEKGDYAFAYYLYDTRTGRRSALSEICEAKQEDFQNATDSAVLESKYIGLDLRYDHTKWNQACVFRSVRTQDAGGTYIAGILHLESIIDLNDWGVLNGEQDGTTEDPTSTLRTSQGYATAVYWYQLNDTSLVYQDVYVDKASYDEGMPKGGASYFYQGTMLVGGISSPSASTTKENRPGDRDRGLGETKWSSIFELSPELFPPLNRYVPDMPTNSITKFLPVGPAVMGFSKDRVYYIMKEGAFLRLTEAHKGMGLINPNAADTVGPMAYYVAPQGLKAIHVNTQIDDVSVLDKLISQDWVNDLVNLQVSFDPTQMTLFIFNAYEKTTAVMWFNTGKVTEIHDVTFSLCSRGHWPTSISDGKSRLEERTLWVMNHPTGTLSDNTTFKAGVWMLDHKRSNLTTDSKKMIRTLQSLAGNGQQTVTSNSDAAFTITLADDTSTSVDVNSDVVGGYVYIVKKRNTDGITSKIDPDFAGMKARIINVSGNVLTLDSTEYNAIKAGSTRGWSDVGIVSISPMFFRYGGPPVTSNPATPDRPAGGNNLFRVKQLSSLGAYFSAIEQKGNLSTLGTNAGMYWKSGLYEGDGTTFKTSALPLDRDGDLVVAIGEGDPDVWSAFYDTNAAAGGLKAFSVSPALEIFCADVDYSLIQVQAKGTLTATQTVGVST